MPDVELRAPLHLLLHVLVPVALARLCWPRDWKRAALWMLAALWAFSFRSPLRAWLTLAGCAALGFAALGLLRLTGAVQ